MAHHANQLDLSRQFCRHHLRTDQRRLQVVRRLWGTGEPTRIRKPTSNPETSRSAASRFGYLPRNGRILAMLTGVFLFSPKFPSSALTSLRASIKGVGAPAARALIFKFGRHSALTSSFFERPATPLSLGGQLSRGRIAAEP